MQDEALYKYRLLLFEHLMHLPSNPHTCARISNPMIASKAHPFEVPSVARSTQADDTPPSIAARGGVNCSQSPPPKQNPSHTPPPLPLPTPPPRVRGRGGSWCPNRRTPPVIRSSWFAGRRCHRSVIVYSRGEGTPSCIARDVSMARLHCSHPNLGALSMSPSCTWGKLCSRWEQALKL